MQNHLHQFESRFQDAELFCTESQLFSNVFSVDFKYVPSRYQLELLKLQSDDLLKDTSKAQLTFRRISLKPNSRSYIYTCCTGLMYVWFDTCVRTTLPLRKLLTSSSRSILSDHDLTCSLRLNIVQSLRPNIDKLTKQKIQKIVHIIVLCPLPNCRDS